MSLSQAWTRYNEYVLRIRTDPESAVDSERNAVQECGGAEVSNNARYSDNFHYATIGYLLECTKSVASCETRAAGRVL